MIPSKSTDERRLEKTLMKKVIGLIDKVSTEQRRFNRLPLKGAAIWGGKD